MFFRKPNVTKEAPGGPGAQLHLAVFGKHPAWDDHMDVLGLDTEPLVEVKGVLYDGIRSQTESPEGWKRLPADRVIPFKHSFVWRRAGGWFIGRLWASSDGKGRTDYPVVVCCQVTGVDGASAARVLLPRLQGFETECKAAVSAGDVKALAANYAAAFRQLAGSLNGASSTLAYSDMIDRMQGGLSDEPLLRVAYQVETQLGAHARGRSGDNADVAPQHIRVPAVVDMGIDSVLFWLQYFSAFTGPATPVMIAAPDAEPWLDVTLGNPGQPEFFCLRAGANSLPAASDVPYTIDDEFRAKARQMLDVFKRSGKFDAEGASDQSSTSRWFKSKLFQR